MPAEAGIQPVAKFSKFNPLYHFSVLKSVAQFHCKMKIAKCKMQIFEGRGRYEFSFAFGIFLIGHLEKGEWAAKIVY
jgi:hypothetical protein